ncbi:hypothetical protein LJC13_01685, partial [Peptostreptococcaceae bacterium OttesenSCG-928-C18]|nr:hypothetical protein [Peptostreptococcaceae bacterium OttesenSCG-928-C18]
KNKIISKIKQSQKFIYSKIEKPLQNMILGKSKFTNYLIVLIMLVLFVPLILNLKVLLFTGKIGSKLIGFGFIILVTLINTAIVIVGPYLSLRILKFNYIKNLDKNTVKSMVLLSSFGIAIINLILYILFGNIADMGMIISKVFGNIFSFKLIITTIIATIIEIYIIGIMIVNKTKDENYSKITLTVTLGVIISKIVSFLIAAPIISLLKEIL